MHACTYTHMHIQIRVEYEMAAPLEYVLVLLNEINLLQDWLPFIGACEERETLMYACMYACVYVYLYM